MIKKLSIILILAIFSGCVKTNPPEETNQETQWGDGIVSENPPGADDWENMDTDSGESDAMVESYPGCSNKIEVWVEPDPLSMPCNFQLVDQDGNYVELYDFEGDVILLDFSTMWCSVCKRVAEHVQDLENTYDPFSIVTVLLQDTGGNQPTVDQLKEWADEYSITTSAVLGGNDMMIGEDNDKWSVSALPTFFLIDKNFYLRIIQPGWNEETITGYIENLLSE